MRSIEARQGGLRLRAALLAFSLLINLLGFKNYRIIPRFSNALLISYSPVILLDDGNFFRLAIYY